MSHQPIRTKEDHWLLQICLRLSTKVLYCKYGNYYKFHTIQNVSCTRNIIFHSDTLLSQCMLKSVAGIIQSLAGSQAVIGISQHQFTLSAGPKPGK